MEANEEEAELLGEFGRIFRQGMGSGMQMAETKMRMNQDRLNQARQANASTQAKLAVALRLEMSDPAFYTERSSREIADAVTVAGQLGPSQQDAAAAFHKAAGELRKQGVDLAGIYREHPGAPAQAHAALVNRLDDLRQARREHSEAQQQDVERQLYESEAVRRGIDTQDVPEALAAERAAFEAQHAAESREDHLDREAGYQADAGVDLAEQVRAEGQMTAEVTGPAEVPAAPVPAATSPRFSGQDRAALAQSAPQWTLARQRQALSFPQGTKARVGANRASKPARGATQGRAQQRRKVSEVSR